jgi:hypothetical protein
VGDLLSQRETENPPLRYLVNLSILHRRLSDLIEDEWLEWGVFGGSGPERPPVSTQRVRGLR